MALNDLPSWVIVCTNATDDTVRNAKNPIPIWPDRDLSKLVELPMTLSTLSRTSLLMPVPLSDISSLPSSWNFIDIRASVLER